MLVSGSMGNEVVDCGSRSTMYCLLVDGQAAKTAKMVQSLSDADGSFSAARPGIICSNSASYIEYVL